MCQHQVKPGSVVKRFFSCSSRTQLQVSLTAAQREISTLSGLPMQICNFCSGPCIFYAIGDGRSVAGSSPHSRTTTGGLRLPNPIIYQLADSTQTGNGLQYANEQLNIPAAQKLATGKNVVVALIDSRVDVANMDIGHAVIETFSPAGNATGEADDHGTAMAGAIAGQGALTGMAPGAKLLSAESFVRDENGNMNGTSFNILRGVDWAFGRNAVIQNLSFAGPKDPLLSRLMAAATAKGTVFLAAAGNAGLKSQPLYPAADTSVIAITAIDQHDQVFTQANWGRYIVAAAPGVVIIVYRPGKTIGFSTGTSVATAQVTGLAALAVERAGQLNLTACSRLLMSAHKGSMPPPKRWAPGAPMPCSWSSRQTPCVNNK